MPLHAQHEQRLRRYAIGLSGTAVVIAVVAGLAMRIPEEDVVLTPETPEPNAVTTTLPPLFITSMTHMEGNLKDDVDESLFNRHIDQLTWAMDLFDEYDAKITVETEESFAKANTVWSRNFLSEVIERSHGVGTHADFGAERIAKDLSFYVRALKANKALVDDLVGKDNNKGISGGTGAYDWVTAMSRAGFDYVDGVVGFAYLAMPESARPDGWTDEYIRTNTYHDAAPVAFAERVVISKLADTDDFIPDDNGVLTVSSGDIGELASLAEGRSMCAPSCVLTNDDVDVFLKAIAEADEVRTATGKAVKVNVHIPMTLWDDENEAVLRYLLSETQQYTDEHENVQWATQLAAYEGYTQWQE